MPLFVAVTSKGGPAPIEPGLVSLHATIALAGVGAGIGIVWLIPIAAGYACPIAFGRGSGQRSLLADEGLMPANHFSDRIAGLAGIGIELTPR